MIAIGSLILACSSETIPSNVNIDATVEARLAQLEKEIEVVSEKIVEVAVETVNTSTPIPQESTPVQAKKASNIYPTPYPTPSSKIFAFTLTPTPIPLPRLPTPEPYVLPKPPETSLINMNPIIGTDGIVNGYSFSLINKHNRPISSTSIKHYNHENGIHHESRNLQSVPYGKSLLNGASIPGSSSIEPNISTDDFSKWFIIWEFETIPLYRTEVIQKITCKGSWEKETICNRHDE